MLNSYNLPTTLQQRIGVMSDEARLQGKMYRLFSRFLHKPVYLDSLDRCQFYR
jgi:hypothetical protein